MSPAERVRFDQAVTYAEQAAAFSLYGCHAEAAHLWVMAARVAVTRSGKRACLSNARDEWRLVKASVTVH